MNGYVYIRKSMPFQTNGLTTIAIIKTAGGLDLLQIQDSCCSPGRGYASFRVGNLAYNSPGWAGESPPPRPGNALKARGNNENYWNS